MGSAMFDYLDNLAELSVTFAAVTILLPVVRQIKGGNLSRGDVHLLTAFMSAGFVVCVSALLPAMFSLMRLDEARLWSVSSGVAALLYAVVTARIQWERSRLSTRGMPRMVMLGFAGHWFVAILLIVNAVVAEVQGPGLYGAAITLSLGISMWLFVRRIGTLRGGNSVLDEDLMAKRAVDQDEDPLMR